MLSVSNGLGFTQVNLGKDLKREKSKVKVLQNLQLSFIPNFNMTLKDYNFNEEN